MAKKNKWPDWVSPGAKAALMKMVAGVKEFEKKHGPIYPSNAEAERLDKELQDGRLPLHDGPHEQ